MKDGEKYFDVKVTMKAPQGYKPRTFSIRGIGVSNKKGAQKIVEEKALALCAETMREANPGVEFKYSVTSTSLNPKFIIVENKEK